MSLTDTQNLRGLRGGILNHGDIHYNTSDGRTKKAYVFNHFLFNRRKFEVSAPSARNGTNVDKNKITKCLKDRGFEVESLQDATKEEVENVLRKIGKLRKSEVSCIVIVIMSHGHQGVICAKDEDYNISSLFSEFISPDCELDGIPKLFFIQACRGNDLDDGIEHLELDGPGNDEDETSIEIPPVPDMLCMFSTASDSRKSIPTSLLLGITFLLFESPEITVGCPIAQADYLSWRNKEKGSWFIQSLSDTLDKTINQETNLLHLLTLVNNQVATTFASETYNYYDSKTLKYHDKKQMTHIESTLTKIMMF